MNAHPAIAIASHHELDRADPLAFCGCVVNCIGGERLYCAASARIAHCLSVRVSLPSAPLLR